MVGENRSENQAHRWYNGIVRALADLGAQPEGFPIAAEDPLFPYELRQMNYGLSARPTHRAVFAIRNDTVVVLRIRHLAQGQLTPEDL